jgi:hypothetical protein
LDSVPELKISKQNDSVFRGPICPGISIEEVLTELVKGKAQVSRTLIETKGVLWIMKTSC